jgi:hypothetical protein
MVTKGRIIHEHESVCVVAHGVGAAGEYLLSHHTHIDRVVPKIAKFVEREALR